MSLSKLFDAYQRMLNRRFLLVQCIQTGLLMATGDVISQQFVEKRRFREHNYKRTFQSAFLGCCLVGPATTRWYKLLNTTLGHKNDLSTAVKKVAADQLIFAPGFLVIFITALGLLNGGNAQTIQNEFNQEYADIILTNWTIWPAVQTINFYFMPLKYQVLLVQSVAVFWNTYLSWKTQSDTH